jgi:hypothetical protein
VVQTEAYVFRNGQMRKQRMVLKDQPNRSQFWWWAVIWSSHWLAIEKKRPLLQRLKSCDDPEQRTFATARSSDNAENFSCLKVEGNVA